MKAHHDWKLPEDPFGLAGGNLERGGAVDHDGDARSFTELEPGGLRHGAPERGDGDDDRHLVKIGSSGDVAPDRAAMSPDRHRRSVPCTRTPPLPLQWRRT